MSSKFKSIQFLKLIIVIALILGIIIASMVFIKGNNRNINQNETIRVQNIAESLTEVPNGYTGIWTAEDLQNMREDLKGKYILMSDIDMSGRDWDIIGKTASSKFTGIFDGNYHKIINLNVESNARYVGMFGYVQYATIKNVILENEKVKSTYEGNDGYVGGLAGYVYGSIYSRRNTDISTHKHSGGSGGSITRLEGIIINGDTTIEGTYGYIGGISGYVRGTSISKSYSEGKILSNSSNGTIYVGGLVGEVYGYYQYRAWDSRITCCSDNSSSSVSDSYSAMDINVNSTSGNIYAGGLVGLCYSSLSIIDDYNNRHPIITSISNAYSIGKMNIETEGQKNIGGLIGSLSGYSGNSSVFSSYSNLYWSPEITGVYTDATTGAKPVLYNKMSKQSTFAGFNFDTTWDIEENTFPYLKQVQKPDSVNRFNYSEYEIEGEGTEENPYIITKESQLAIMFCEPGANYKLGNDINLSKDFEPIGNSNKPFKGCFDGDGNTISNLNISTTNSYAGLFGYIDGGEVKNLNIQDININKSGTSATYLGAVVGYVKEGVLENINVSNGTIKNNSNTNAVYIGGIAGYAKDTEVNNSTTNVAVIGTTSSSAYVGGIIGHAEKSRINYGKTMGDVSGTSTNSTAKVGGLVGDSVNSLINTSYVEGDVKANTSGGTIYAGGLIGEVAKTSLQDSIVANSYAIGNINAIASSGSPYAGGLIGHVTGNPNITNTYAVGEVDARATTESKIHTGGLVADGEAECISSYWSPITTRQEESSVGNDYSKKSIQQLSYQEAYEGWDFTNIWQIKPDGNSLAYLKYIGDPDKVPTWKFDYDTRISIKVIDDKENPLSGAEVEIFNNRREVVKTGVSNDKGIVDILDLDPGVYGVRETKSPVSYQIDTEPQYFELTEKGETVSVSTGKKIYLVITNTKIKIDLNKIQIEVVDENNNSTKINNATLDVAIFNENCEVIYNEELNTNSNGIANVGEINELGDIFIEVEAFEMPNGYNNIPIKVIQFENNEDEITLNSEETSDDIDITLSENGVMNIRLFAEKSKFNLNVNIADEQNDKTKLCNTEVNVINPDGTTIKGKTDTEGELTLLPIKEGESTKTYVIQVKDAMPGYSTAQGTINIQFDSMGNIVNADSSNSNISNISFDDSNVNVTLKVSRNGRFDNIDITLFEKGNETKTVTGAGYSIYVSSENGFETVTKDITNGEGNINLGYRGDGQIYVEIKQTKGAKAYKIDKNTKEIILTREDGNITINSFTPENMNCSRRNNDIYVELFNEKKNESYVVNIQAVYEEDDEIKLQNVGFNIVGNSYDYSYAGVTDINGNLELKNLNAPGEGTYEYTVTLGDLPSLIYDSKLKEFKIRITFDENCNPIKVGMDMLSEYARVVEEDVEDEENIAYISNVQVDIGYRDKIDLYIVKRSKNNGAMIKGVAYDIKATINDSNTLSMKKQTDGGGKVNVPIPLGSAGDRVTLEYTEIDTAKGYLMDKTIRKVVLELSDTNEYFVTEYTVTEKNENGEYEVKTNNIGDLNIDLTHQTSLKYIKINELTERQEETISVNIDVSDRLETKLGGLTFGIGLYKSVIRKNHHTYELYAYTSIKTDTEGKANGSLKVSNAGKYILQVSQGTTIPGHKAIKPVNMYVRYSEVDHELRCQSFIINSGKEGVLNFETAENKEGSFYAYDVSLDLVNEFTSTVVGNPDSDSDDPTKPDSNGEKTCYIVINKIDKDTKAHLAGVTYNVKVTYEDGSSTEKEYMTRYSRSNYSGKVSYVPITTDRIYLNGKVNVEITERSTWPSYKLDPKTYTINIEEDTPTEVLFPQESEKLASSDEAGQIIANFARDMVENHAEETIYDYGSTWTLSKVAGTTQDNPYYNNILNYGRLQAYQGNKVTGYAQASPLGGGSWEFAEDKYFMDCVGFVSFCIHHSLGLTGNEAGNFVVPGAIRKTDYFEEVTDSTLKPGDIIYTSTHVMMYIGNDTFAESSDINNPGWHIKFRSNLPDSYKVARIKDTAAKQILRSQTKNAWDGIATTQTGRKIKISSDIEKLSYDESNPRRIAVTFENEKDNNTDTRDKTVEFFINLDIIKRNMASNILFSGAEFNVKIKNGENVVYENNITTDSSGLAIISRIPVNTTEGTIEITETQEPLYCIRDDETKIIKYVVEDGTIKFTTDNDIEFISSYNGKAYGSLSVYINNEINKFGLSIINVDKDDYSIRINGSKFKITDEYNREKEMKITKKGTGIVYLECMAGQTNRYVINQIIVGGNYKRIEKPILLDVEFDSDGNVLSADVVNEEGYDCQCVVDKKIEGKTLQLQIANEPKYYRPGFGGGMTPVIKDEADKYNVVICTKSKTNDNIFLKASYEIDINGENGSKYINSDFDHVTSFEEYNIYGNTEIKFKQTLVESPYIQENVEKVLKINRSVDNTLGYKDDTGDFDYSIDDERKIITIINYNDKNDSGNPGSIEQSRLKLRVYAENKYNSKELINGIGFDLSSTQNDNHNIVTTALVYLNEPQSNKITYTLHPQNGLEDYIDIPSDIIVEAEYDEAGEVKNVKIVQGQEFSSVSKLPRDINVVIDIEEAYSPNDIDIDPGPNPNPTPKQPISSLPSQYKYKVKIVEEDFDDPEIKLTDVELSLDVTKENGSRKTYKDITDEDGSIENSYLTTYGTTQYVIKELSTLNGYIEDKEEKTVVIGKGENNLAYIKSTSGDVSARIIEGKKEIIITLKSKVEQAGLTIESTDSSDAFIRIPNISYLVQEDVGARSSNNIYTNKEGYAKAIIPKDVTDVTRVFTIHQGNTPKGFIKNDDIKLQVEYNQNGIKKAQIIENGTQYATIVKQDTDSIKLKVANNREEYIPPEANLEPYTINVIKVDENNIDMTKSGAELQVYLTGQDGFNITKTAITEEDGIINIDNISVFGELRVDIHELKAPEHMELINEESYIILNRDEETGSITHKEGANLYYDIDDENKVVTLYVTNRLDSDFYSIVLNKIDTLGNGVKGTEFKLTLPNGEIVENVVSIKNGFACVTNLDMPTEEGTYTYRLKEVKAPNEYKLIKDEIVFDVTFRKNEKEKMCITNVNIRENADKCKLIDTKYINRIDNSRLERQSTENTTGEIKVPNCFELSITNTELNAILRIKTVDEENGDRLKGAKYKITVKNLTTNQSYVIEKTDPSDDEEIIIQKGIKGSGDIQVEIEEISYPDGYCSGSDGNKKIIKFSRDQIEGIITNTEGIDNVTDNVLDVTIKNKISVISIKLNKYDFGDRTKLDGVKFGVSAKRITSTGEQDIGVRIKKDGRIVNVNEITTGVDDVSGEALLKNIVIPEENGTYIYTFEETKALEGYESEYQPIKVRIDVVYNQSQGGYNVTNAQIINEEPERKPIEIVISKDEEKELSRDINVITDDLYRRLNSKGLNRNIVNIKTGNTSTFSSDGTNAKDILQKWKLIGPKTVTDDSGKGTQGYPWEFTKDNEVASKYNNAEISGFYEPNVDAADIKFSYDVKTTGMLGSYPDDDTFGIMVRFKENNGKYTGYVLQVTNGSDGNFEGTQLYRLENMNFDSGTIWGAYLYGKYYNGNGSVELCAKTSQRWRWGEVEKFEVVAEDSVIEIKMNGSTIIRYDDPNPIESGAYGFWCWSQSNTYFSNIAIKAENRLKNYEETLDSGIWKNPDDKVHCAINISDREEDVFTTKMNNTVSTSIDRDINYIGLGTNLNKKQNLDYIERNNNNGTFIDNSDYDKALDEIAEFIKNLSDAKMKKKYPELSASHTKNEVTIDVANEKAKTFSMNFDDLTDSKKVIVTNVETGNRYEEEIINGSATVSDISGTGKFKIEIIGNDNSTTTLSIVKNPDTGYINPSHENAFDDITIDNENIAINIGPNNDEYAEFEYPIKSSAYKIDYDNKLIKNVKPNTTVDNFANNISTSQGYSVTDNNGNGININSYKSGLTSSLTTDSLVKTGTKLEIEGETYTIIVTGDVDGDGRLSMQDVTKINLSVSKLKVLKGIYEIASDINLDNKINAFDLIRANLAVANLIKL